MQIKKSVKVTTLAILLIACATASWWYFKPKQTQPQYITATATHSDLEDAVLATGTLEAKQMVSVGAQASGQVKKMYVQLGDHVKQGQLIAQIDSIRQQNDLKTAEANIKNLQAQLAIKEANLAKVDAEYQRQQAMYAQDASSKADLETALANYRTAKADIAATQAQIEQSKLSLATARENLNYTRIVAPLDGTVVAIVADEGQTVNANQSTPTIVKLAQLDIMTVRAQVSEADVMKVKEGQTVYFTTLGNSEQKHYAKLRQIEPAPDSINTEGNSKSTTTTSSSAIYYNALFDVPNPDNKLRIDMTAQVSIVLANAKNVLTIPAAALQSKNRPKTQKNSQTSNAKTSATPLQLTTAEKQLLQSGQVSLATVRVIQADGSTRPQSVLIGLNNRVNAQILRGLKEGDQVVLGDTSDTSNNAAKSSTRTVARLM